MIDMKKYFDYLDALRESGAINMFGALPYLQEEFPELGFDRQRAASVLKSWMESFGKEQGSYVFITRMKSMGI